MTTQRDGTRLFKRVLIANRGEIAVRIIQACKELDIETVAIYSEADASALHVSLANEAHLIGPPAATDSYLRGDHIVEVAKLCGAEAVHPGYGFLAENGAFAGACIEAGLVFIGPSPEAMEAMGGKISARRLAEAASVPVVPGASVAVESLEQAEQIAARIGYPVAIKASAGGGGRGLKVALDSGKLEQSLASARREGMAYFNDSTVFIERYVAEPRHVEVQILADIAGTVVSLGQRDCSVQRNHQKLIEEAPANIPGSMQTAMDDASVRLARDIGYIGAGTLEFLVTGDQFYFLEMNTRVQVEHTVTEMVTGIDIVQAQIRIAAGERLWFSQDDVAIHGHAIQCRINAEDPSQGFRPAPSRITTFRAPTGAGVRFDSSVYQGYTISSHYDSMIAKLIVWAPDRDASRRRMLRALDEMVLLGPPTTIPFHIAALSHPDFVGGNVATTFIERMDLGSLQAHGRSLPITAIESVGTQPADAALDSRNARKFQIRVEGQTYQVEVAESMPAPTPGRGAALRQHHSTEATGGAVTSPLHGVVLNVQVEVGATVAKGAVVCVIEAMKMENEVLAPHAGIVSSIAVRPGDTVDTGALLLTVRTHAE